MEKHCNKYSLEEKEKIADLVEIYKREYEEKVEENKKNPKHWNPKLKKFVTKEVKGGYVARAVRELYPSLAYLKNDDPKFRSALRVANRCIKNRENKRKSFELISKENKKFRGPGGGRKAQAVEVRQAAFDWFVDIRYSLKGRLPMKIFKAKCIELYKVWLNNQPEEIKEENQLKFSRCWIQKWMKEYNVSFLKPNKRFAISQENRTLRIVEFIKNVMKVRYYFLINFKKEPIIINGDQMPLHRNETSNEKTLTQKNQAVYVKENYMLSRERCTVYTQLSTDPENKMPTPEILFKGKGVRIKVNPPEDMNVQFAQKGSYRLENMLEMVNHLKNRHHIFTHKDYALYILDDYSVHLQDELRKHLLQQGYVLVVIGGGITGDIQINDTHLHHQLKAKYREKECELMLQKLRDDPTKIPAPTRDEMMHMLSESWKTVNICPVKALKNNFVLNALDGSEDYLVTDSLMQLVGEEIKSFRKELIKSPPPKSIQELIKSITPPKGVRFKGYSETAVPPDEGIELFDCEGEEISFGEVEVLSDEEFEGLQPQIADTESQTNQSTITNTYYLPTDTPDNGLNSDSTFINEISAALDTYSGKTSKSFLPYFCQFRDLVTKSRRSLKKRISLCSPSTQEDTRIEQGDEPTNQMINQQSALDNPSTSTGL